MTELLSAHSITSALNQSNSPAHIYMGYSGGVDSHVLLHLCTSITAIRDRVTAVYVHHGLQSEAESWAIHCKKTAESLGVDFMVLRVNALPSQGESPEEAARNARYTALKSLIDVNDVLMVAQHRDDQLETVLLQLFRGSGLRGLSAMPESTVFGKGLMLRPLLNVAKSAIDDYAQTHALSWVNDPSNLSNDYDRNYLRNAVLPLLKQRWPSCDKTVARSAKHCADAQVVVSEYAETIFRGVFNEADKTLCIGRLRSYKPTQQALIIRQWFQFLQLKMPAQAFIERLQSDVISATEDREPELSEQGYCVRRYRGKLYCLKVVTPEIVRENIWSAGQASLSVSKNQTLFWQLSSVGINQGQWQKATIIVRARSGGEKISLPGRQGRHTLKKLFQEAGIPPWERDAIPLVYLDDKLAAVGDLWICSDFYSEQAQDCIRLSLQKTVESSV
ncbi:tRNA lysidine(34) synthetase TilS [Methylobacter sp. S3L5C]|uniref:tRNA lysidine(34) synthetase TilS n=1 Tax=Methylobacter sp. S3L5C TaxID=2839024 RepID=UPI001FAC7ED9|nr:tRNA lysidine(34) synthetase TilS [Methylobacter sp. S3L5C]UOA09398.1 tRNA lysidine(34) synthetase TilS [Methylobacter sp. S3L5C]